MSPAATGLTVGTPAGPVTVPARVGFVEPLPGLPGHTAYTLDPLDEIGFLFALRADGGAGVRLFVVSPALVFPGYDPRIPRSALDVVCGPGAEPAYALLAVVHPGDGLAPTVDLLAPIVVDTASGRALQTVLDEDLPLRAPLG